MPGTTFVGSTSNQDVNGLLSGIRWAPSGLTFSFPSSASYYSPGYGSGEPLNGFAQLNATQQSAVRVIFQGYSAVANLTFTEITETASVHADLRFARSTVPSTAWAYYPWSGEEGGDTWVRNSSTYNNPTKGNYAYLTFVHEIGHALGLKHGHETDTYGAMTTAHDSMEYSVMTYRGYVGASTTGGYTNEQWGYAQTPMMYDIAALQTMYGANYNTNSGNTTYSWSPTTGELFINGVGQGAPGGNRVFMTVWDGGGADIYDFSNYTTSLTVDLTPGSWTITSQTQLARLDYFAGNTHIAAGNIANALLFNNNVSSLIEGAYGGSAGDSITGNQANNTLRGNGGNDSIDGGAGTDTAFFSGNRAQYQITFQANGSWQVVDLRGGSPDGTDTLVNVEYFQFADQLFSTLNSPPIVAVSNKAIAAGNSVAASTLFSVTDADGDPIVTYRLYDQSPDAASGRFLVNGVQQGTNQNIDLTPSQFAQTTFVAGTVQDRMWVQVYDGSAWSQWYEFYNYPPAPPVNHAPIVTVSNLAIAAGNSVAASALFSVFDADGDSVVTYRLYDQSPDTASGRFLVNSVQQGTNQNIDLTPSQFAQTTFVAGTVQDRMWVQVYDGFAWSQWYEFYNFPPAPANNHAPVVTVSNKAITAGSSVAASTLFSVFDQDGDSIVTYRLYDQSPDAASGRFLVNGVQQGTNQNIDLTSSQFAQTTFVAGSVQDRMWVQVYDGAAWSQWYEFYNYPPASPQNHAPVISVSNKAIAAGSSVAASTLFSVSDQDGDSIVTYRLYDQSPDAASGRFLVSGVQQGTNQNIDLTPSQFAQTTFVAGSVQDRLWVQVYDGFAWSQWYEFYNYPPAPPPSPQNLAPSLTVADKVMAVGSSVAASTLFLVNDPNGDNATIYRLYDQSSSGSSGRFLLNGVDQGYNHNIDLTPSQLAQTTFQAGSVQDRLWVQVYDGAAWSAWYEFYVNPPSGQQQAPQVTVANKTMDANDAISAASLFLVSDPNGDTIVSYRVYDQSPDASSGRFLLNGVDQGYNHNIDLTPAQLAQTTFVAGTVQDRLWVQVYDGVAWSEWKEFFVNPPDAGAGAHGPDPFPEYLFGDEGNRTQQNQNDHLTFGL